MNQKNWFNMKEATTTKNYRQEVQMNCRSRNAHWFLLFMQKFKKFHFTSKAMKKTTAKYTQTKKFVKISILLSTNPHRAFSIVIDATVVAVVA